MFQPAAFREDRLQVIEDHIHQHSFATLVTAGTGTLSGDHLPLALHTQENVLRGHVARANPLFQKSNGPMDVLAIFQGPQTYISPNWYPSKQDHGKAVPTWNYIVAHVHGRLNFIQDPEWVLQHLNDLTAKHEAPRENPWSVSDAPQSYIQQQMRALVGFEIEITQMLGTWKVSQNKTDTDKQGVLTGLKSEGTANAADIANLVDARS
jgi:transcriptional regulator